MGWTLFGLFMSLGVLLSHHFSLVGQRLLALVYGIGLCGLVSLPLLFMPTWGVGSWVVVSSSSAGHWSGIDMLSGGVDGVGWSLVWLTGFITFLCLVYNYHVIGFGYAKFNFLIVVTSLLLIGSFTVKSLLVFYLFFEATLMPMFLLLGLGSRGRKTHAAYYLFFFTFASSVLILLGLAYLYGAVGSWSFTALWLYPFSSIQETVILLLFTFGFAAKIPLLPLHIWLPEAHVEAPTVGSVLLAALLLKLGAYGLVRVILPVCGWETLTYWGQILVPFILFSLLFPAWVAVRQVDIKKIVAYSSVVHMGFALLGLLSFTDFGIQGFLFLLISHGLISAGLFFVAGMLYDRFHVRNLAYMGGLAQFMPMLGVSFFFLIFSNFSVPGTCNFVGELLVLYAVYAGWGIVITGWALVSLFTTVLFCISLLSRVFFYQVSGLLIYNLVDVTWYEFLVLVSLLINILGFGLFPNTLLAFLG